VSRSTREPVASVPMNESIRITTTTNPLMQPMMSATPMPASRATTTFACSDTTRCAAVTPDNDMT
jgi:hypothetical protein